MHGHLNVKYINCVCINRKHIEAKLNCIQYSLAWVFLPFVHVVKF